MKNFLNKNKFILLTNLFIIISYIFIASKPELFGIDDITANSYTFNPGLTFIESIKLVANRAIYWNARIGEVLYFIVGCFPRWVYFILNSICLITFLNLVFAYLYGKNFKKYIYSFKYPLALITNYLIILTIYPAFSETIIWMAGAFNHLWDTTLVLLVGLPFRLLLDNYDIFKNRKKTKYLFFVLCALAGFSTEHIVPWLLVYISIITLFMYKKKKNINWCIFSILILLISFICMYFCNSTIFRVEFFENLDWALNSKKIMIIDILRNYKYIINLIFILLIISVIKSIFCKNRKEFYNKLIMSILYLILSCISIIVLFLAPYFVIRTTILLFFFILVLITCLIDYIVSSKIISYFLIAICLCFVIFVSFKLNYFYKDFNLFNKYRDNYMQQQVNDGKTIIDCPMYDNKYNYFFPIRLTSFEYLYCDLTYIRYLFENEDLGINYIYIERQ